MKDPLSAGGRQIGALARRRRHAGHAVEFHRAHSCTLPGQRDRPDHRRNLPASRDLHAATRHVYAITGCAPSDRCAAKVVTAGALGKSHNHYPSLGSQASPHLLMLSGNQKIMPGHKQVPEICQKPASSVVTEHGFYYGTTYRQAGSLRSQWEAMPVASLDECLSSDVIIGCHPAFRATAGTVTPACSRNARMKQRFTTKEQLMSRAYAVRHCRLWHNRAVPCRGHCPVEYGRTGRRRGYHSGACRAFSRATWCRLAWVI